jgi:DNA transposition AAA+ family ATPase
MKTGHFVEGLSNVQRFLDGQRTTEQRGAREASWHLVKGEPGYGKSRTLLWWGAKKTPVVVRAKADWTPAWALKDISACLGLSQSHRVNVMFESVCTELMAKGCPPIVIDEIDHATRSVRVLETLRDITDTSECILVAGGMKDAEGLMKRYPQIHSRIAKVTSFGPATAADVALICEQLCEVDLAADLAEEICRRTAGRVRLVMNAIARVERVAKGTRGKVQLADMKGRALINADDRPEVAP